jgi:hypothetical protein
MNLELYNIINNMSFWGVINTIIYIYISFGLLPTLEIFTKVKISFINYLIWYIWSFAYSIYVLYIILKKKRNTRVEKVTYNWFMVGGYGSYKDMFVLSELEPLYEYALLGIIILIPVANSMSYKQKFQAVLYKIAIFHIIATMMLMNWTDLIVNYEFSDVDLEIK